MPVVPFIPAIIGAAGSIGSSLINKSAAGGGGGSATNTANFNQFNDMLENLAGKSSKLMKFGKKDRIQFREALDPAATYWKDILASPDASKTASLFAPELNQIGKQTSQAIQSIGEFGPRGGGTNSAIGALQGQQAGQISDLFTRAKPMAAQNLASIAPLYSSLAANEQGLAISGRTAASGQSLTSALGQMWGDIERRKQSLGAAGGLGSGIGGLLGQLLPKLFGKSGGGGGGFPAGTGDVLTSLPFPKI